MRTAAFPFASTLGSGMLPANERPEIFGQPLDGAKETHIRACFGGRGKRCASLHEACA
jgi:hypothetical protein